MKDHEGKPIIFYDGSCGLCHRSVQFLLRHDQKQIFLFAPLQGKTAAHLIPKVNSNESIVLLENNKRVFLFGKAAFRTLWLLGGIWAIPGLLSFFPSFLYDWLYLWIAKHRYRWFGRESCMIPKTKEKKRFLP